MFAFAAVLIECVNNDRWINENIYKFITNIFENDNLFNIFSQTFLNKHWQNDYHVYQICDFRLFWGLLKWK